VRAVLAQFLSTTIVLSEPAVDLAHDPATPMLDTAGSSVSRAHPKRRQRSPSSTGAGTGLVAIGCSVTTSCATGWQARSGPPPAPSAS
jgi:hypothetical protein